MTLLTILWAISSILSLFIFGFFTRPMYKNEGYKLDPAGYQLGLMVISIIPILNVIVSYNHLIKHFKS